MNSEAPSHYPVLKEEIVAAFASMPLRYVVDATLGLGGHATALLTARPEIEAYVGIDRDPDALAIARKNLSVWESKLHLVRGSFADLEKHVEGLPIGKCDAILMDLGVSSMQLDIAARGFSFMQDGPLDMRMDPQGSLTATDIVNEWEERAIGEILRDYGEERHWKKIAHTIVSKRALRPITTTFQLVELLAPLIRYLGTTPSIHPLTRTFQALRIAVNGELAALTKALPQALGVLNAGGRLAVISFHSLEDRIVKHFMQQAASDKYSTTGLSCGLFLDKKPQGVIETRKPITASASEIDLNPRSRSAKLRILKAP